MIVVSYAYTKLEIQTRNCRTRDIVRRCLILYIKIFKMFLFFLSSWARTPTLQDSPSPWQMWLFFQLLPLCSDLGECKIKCPAFFSRGCTNNASHSTQGGAPMSPPPLCPAGCLLNVTRNWESTTLCWRSGQASKPAGLLIGWRIQRDKTHWKTSEIHQSHRHLSCFGFILLL